MVIEETFEGLVCALVVHFSSTLAYADESGSNVRFPEAGDRMLVLGVGLLLVAGLAFLINRKRLKADGEWRKKGKP